MIYVTVSGMSLPFWRLIKKMDEIAGQIDEEVLIQGGADYTPSHAKYVKYLRREEAMNITKDARLVVSHAGAGTIINAIHFAIPIIIVPRLKRLKEHYSDHQLELAKKLESRKGIKVIYDVNVIKDSLDFSEEPNFDSVGKDRLTGAIKQFVDRLARLQARKNG